MIQTGTSNLGNFGGILDYSSALERTGGDESFLKELLDIYREDFVLKYEQLKKSLEQKHFEAIQRLAHGLKGSSANLALTSLQETLFQLEIAGIEKDIDKARSVFSLLEIEFQRLQDLLAEEVLNREKTADEKGVTAACPELPKTEAFDIEESIQDLIPEYLENRRKDLEKMAKALKESDLAAIELIAHRIKGSGECYGFKMISELGQEIERSAQEQNPGNINSLLKEFESYLEAIRL